MKEDTQLISTMGELNKMLIEIIHVSKEIVEENKAILNADL